jgi:hypothetical protein
VYIESKHKTAEELTALIPKMRLGEQKAIDEFVLAFVPWATKAASAQAFKFGVNKDDLMGAAYEAIVIGANRIVSGALDHDNVQGFMKLTIRGRLDAALQYRAAVTLPDRKGPHSLTEEVLEEHAVTETQLFELTLEDVMNMCNTDRQRAFIQLRFGGATEIQISQMWGVSSQSIYKLRAEISELIRNQL